MTKASKKPKPEVNVAANPVGRPRAYSKEMAGQAEKLCRLGATDIEVADFFGVDVRTIYRWKHDFPEFCQALVIGKDAPDERVVRSLYNRAVGYSHESVKIFMPAGAKQPVYAPYIEHVPPDSQAAFIWLKNRRKDDWHDRQEIEHSGSIGLADRVRRARERTKPDG